MAFKKKTWTDRMVEYAGRRKLTNISTKQAIVYDVERAEGTVSKEGDAFSSQNMNDFEQRVEDGFAGVQQDINEINSDLAGYKFGTTSDGKPGYIMPGGADTVIPFKSHTIFDASVSVGSSDASSVTVPLTKYYPNYSKITAANIFVKYKNGTLMGYAKTGGSSFSSVLGLSYNNSTGNLTISNAGNNTAGGFYYYRGSTQVFTICIVP